MVRENTEDAYTGIGGIFKARAPDDEIAIATMLYTRKGVERVIRYAFEQASKRGRKKVTLVDKANAIRAAGHLDPHLRGGQRPSSRTSRPTTCTSMRRACGW